MIFEMTGGAAKELNFKIKAYETEEAMMSDVPKQNTIGVVTTTDITGWEFNATQPSSPSNGMIWIYTGTSSEVEFNALKKNGIKVYPLSANQYVSGAWVDVTAMSYQGGEWVEWWNGYFFNNGLIPSIVTGWTACDNDGNVGLDSIADGSVSFGNTIKATISNYKKVTVFPLPAIDLTPYSKFVVDVQYSIAGNSSYTHSISIESDLLISTSAEARTTVSGTNRQTVEIDISAFSGVYYCGVCVSSVSGATTSATIYSMKLVK